PERRPRRPRAAGRAGGGVRGRPGGARPPRPAGRRPAHRRPPPHPRAHRHQLPGRRPHPAGAGAEGALMGFVIAIGALAALALGAPIFAVFLAVAAYGATVTSRVGFEAFSAQMQDVVALGTGEPATILSTIPLFIFAGFLMAESKTADRVVRAAQAGLGWLPGGLAVVTIFACAIFTAFTGASGVTIVALGGLLMPSLLKERYPERFSLGLVAGTGSVGLLFPPAVPLFVYGTVYGFTMQAMAATESAGDMKLIDFSTDRFIF